jgi:hypothetical protein
MHIRARRAALSGLLSALAVVFLMMGSLIPAALYACPILAMLALLPIREEFGRTPALTAYAAVSLLAVLLVPDKELAFLFVFFGWYPPVQPLLDRIRPRLLQAAVKLALANGAAVILYSLLLWVFQLESVTAELEGVGVLMVAVLLLCANILFVLTDIVLHRIAFLWNRRIRKKAR